MWVRCGLDKVVRDADALSFVGHATASKVSTLIAWCASGLLHPSHPHPPLASSRRNTTPDHHPTLVSGWFLVLLLVLIFFGFCFFFYRGVCDQFEFASSKCHCGVTHPDLGDCAQGLRTPQSVSLDSASWPAGQNVISSRAVQFPELSATETADPTARSTP